MAELVWKGKPDVRGRPAAPPEPGELRSDELHSDGAPNAWHNRLILGDVTRVLSSLLGEFAGKVSLVYIDPPFDTGGDFHYLASVHGMPAGTPRIAVPAYGDARGLDSWLTWFFATARVLRDLLVDGGSLYVHLDTNTVHYAKVALDEVFGRGAFQREIVWRIGWVSGFKSRANNWIRNHDVILFYSKKGERRSVFHKEYVPYPPGYVRRDGVPPRGAGYPIEDVWNASDVDRLDSIQIKSFSREKVGFPTQKNEGLVARIVRASSDPGDLVLDCFVGSGTTAAVAEKLGRRWIASDVSPVAIHAARNRLLALGGVRPFVVQSDGASQGPPKRKLAARLAMEGFTARVELLSFDMPARVAPVAASPAVGHWSQWIDGWCVDWDHDEGPLRVGSTLWRRHRGKDPLALSATHRYAQPGRRAVLVKAFDVLGGATTRRLRADVAR